MPTNRFPRYKVFDFCLNHWGKEPSEISFPGGEGRKTVLVTVDGTQFAISKRSSKDRAALEGAVLSALSDTGAVPRLVAQPDGFVVQQFVEGDRLTLALETARGSDRVVAMNNAVTSLLTLQECGVEQGLLNKVPKIGMRRLGE